MLRLIGIIFLNLWHGVSRKSGAPALMVLLVASVTVLSLSHNGAAQASRPDDHQSSSRVASSNANGQVNTSPTLAFVNPALGTRSSNGAKLAQNQSQPKTATKNKSTDQADKTASSKTPKISVATITLPQTTDTCSSQGQSQVSLMYASVILKNVPQNNKSSLHWYWETRIDSGTNTSDQSPIDDSPRTTPITSDNLKLSASDPTEPLLLANNNSDYSYSFRLHVTGPTDITSAWVSVPQAASCED